MQKELSGTGFSPLRGPPAVAQRPAVRHRADVLHNTQAARGIRLITEASAAPSGRRRSKQPAPHPAAIYKRERDIALLALTSATSYATGTNRLRSGRVAICPRATDGRGPDRADMPEGPP